MTRLPLSAFLATLALLLAAPVTAAPATPADNQTSTAPASKPAKKHVARNAQKRVPKGIGFLPGYRTPEQIERDRHNEIQRERRAYYRAGGPRIAYWRYAQPGFYRGRWNGGDFGPCWKLTPIGYMPTCGQ